MLRPEDIGNTRLGSRSAMQDARPAEAGVSGIRSRGAARTQIHIEQMECVAEEALIRRKLGGMRDVTSMKFDLLRRMLIIEHEVEALGPILAGLRSLGFDPRLVPETGATDRVSICLLGCACAVAMASQAASWFDAQTSTIVMLALSAVAASGLAMYRAGLLALCRGHFTIDALVGIAVTAALLIGEWPEAAMISVCFAIADWVEKNSLRRARNATAALLKSLPARAAVLQADGAWSECAVDGIAAGEIVRVKAGECIPFDGEVVRGRSTVNQSPITGASRPVAKGKGDAVFAGTLNETGTLDMLVTGGINDSTLARIVHAIEEAQMLQAPTQRLLERVVRTWLPAVLLGALGLALLPPLALDGEWFASVHRALVLLVIACPCALVISTPVTIVSGLARAARHGIVVKGGAFLERGRRLRWLALDKSGTLTHGTPVQTAFELLDARFEQSIVRAFAASLAGRSPHPASRAIAQAARNEHIPRFAVSRFGSVRGRGVFGFIGGRRYWLGNLRLMAEIGHDADNLRRRVEAQECVARTVVIFASDAGVLALFAVADTLRPMSRDAVARLRAVGVRTVVLTGDNPHLARAVAKQAGIDRAQGGLLPEDKLRIIETLGRSAPVGMVGDGLKDAPAFARADITFAMNAMDTDAAFDTADVALMDDDLCKLPAFIRLSKAMHATLLQNIAIAVGIKAVCIGLTLGGHGSMWLAVFADTGTCLIVIANGLRLLRTRLQ
ncbi:heavy metal translocating P-type ATPase [Caballeronia sp. LZ043]|uniref:heavy metal translocating P-type ATPase n=1 Tax=Caballeronia sp. LZ043 TaxID=3038569 RepID=UPI00285FF898|nr:heavy metal translocating P-type ATPase [Caballeronia sp. LZ043]MDR5824004.1 heavy metal translocating P-type ATPase [Caballeronia sp. LZ043]